MNVPRHLPQTRANVAAASREWRPLFDCLECSRGVYRLDGRCSCCGASAPAAIRHLMGEKAPSAA